MKKMVSKISVDEQEVSINFLRKDDLAEIYVSDNTWITKLEKLCQKSPDLYKKVNEKLIELSIVCRFLHLLYINCINNDFLHLKMILNHFE